MQEITRVLEIQRQIVGPYPGPGALRLPRVPPLPKIVEGGGEFGLTGRTLKAIAKMYSKFNFCQAFFPEALFFSFPVIPSEDFDLRINLVYNYKVKM